MKSNAVAWTAYQHRGLRKRGAPRKYGRKFKVKSLLNSPEAFQKANSPVDGENKVTIQYASATCCGVLRIAWSASSR